MIIETQSVSKNKISEHKCAQKTPNFHFVCTLKRNKIYNVHTEIFETNNGS